MTESQKPTNRIFGIDFARSICAIIVIVFHYAGHTINEHKILYVTATSGWGDIAVTVFFAISGATLYYIYPKIISLKRFYFARWKSIFPCFYLCFLYYFIQNVFLYHKLFYGPEPITLLYTLFGMDGYFLYCTPNYYIIGEWFLGAIILLYLLYPWIIWIMKKSSIILPCILIIGYIIILGTDWFIILPFRNLITCIASFYFGVLIMKYKEYSLHNNITLGIALIVFVWLTFFPFPINLGKGGFIIEQVHGFVFLIVLIRTGEMIKKPQIKRLFSWISSISFPIFLFQHKIILKVLGVYEPNDLPGELLNNFLTIILTIICAQVLSIVNKALLDSKTFTILEKKVLY